MKNQLPLIAIVSAFTSNCSFRENHEKHWDLCNSLDDDGTSYVEATGSYNGMEELSVILPDVNTAKALASVYYQDCILVRYPSGSCYLEYTNGNSTEYIGEWSELLNKPETDFTQIGHRFFSTKLYSNKDAK